MENKSLKEQLKKRMGDKILRFKDDLGVINALSAKESIEELFQGILNVYHDVEVRLSSAFYTYKKTPICCVDVLYTHQTTQKKFLLRMEKISAIDEKLGWALIQDEEEVITFTKAGIELEMTVTSNTCKRVETGKMIPERKTVCNMFLD